MMMMMVVVMMMVMIVMMMMMMRMMMMQQAASHVQYRLPWLLWSRPFTELLLCHYFTGGVFLKRASQGTGHVAFHPDRCNVPRAMSACTLSPKDRMAVAYGVPRSVGKCPGETGPC